jgi:hypothetical protein
MTDNDRSQKDDPMGHVFSGAEATHSHRQVCHALLDVGTLLLGG